MKAVKKPRRGPRDIDSAPHCSLRGEMASAQDSRSCHADRIHVRLWARRCLNRADEAALASSLDQVRADQHWNWTGAVLCGEISADEALSVTEIVDHLCALQSLPELVRIDFSQPHMSDHEPAAWLHVRTDTPALKLLCALYGRRLLTAEAVVDALGGFVVRPAFGARADSG